MEKSRKSIERRGVDFKELADLETDTMKKVQELMEMAGDYE